MEKFTLEQANFENSQLKEAKESSETKEVNIDKTEDVEKKIKNILKKSITFHETDQGILMTEKQYKDELRKAEQKGETLKQHFH